MDTAQFISQPYTAAVKKIVYPIVRLDGQSYEMININRSGMAVQLTDTATFSRPGVDVSIELTLEIHRLTMRGRIVHLTPTAEGGAACVIRFSNLTGPARVTLESFLARQRRH